MNKGIGIQLIGSGDLNMSVLRDENEMIISGITVGDTLYQNQYIILKAQKGDLKENPVLGVGLDDMTNDDDILSWKKAIREEFAKDLLKVSTLTIDNSGITLQADYQ